MLFLAPSSYRWRGESSGRDPRIETGLSCCGAYAAQVADWARPVVHFEIVAVDAERQVEFYRSLFNWEIGEGPIMQVSPGLGGPEPGPGGHIREGEKPSVSLYVQVRDLRASLALAEELGGTIVAEPFDIPGGPTIAAVADPEGNPVGLVQQ